MEEEVIWTGKPSQLANLNLYLLCLLLAWLIVPLFIAWKRVREIRGKTYTVKANAISVSHPRAYQFNRLLELERIRGITLKPCLAYKPFHLVDVVWQPTDDFTPAVVFQAVSFDESLRVRILQLAEKRRQIKSVREIALPILP